MNIIPMRCGPADLQGLVDLCRDIIRRSDKVVEIGCYAGESSRIIARYAEKLYCVDPWKDGVTETGASTHSQFQYREMAKVQALFDANLAGHDNVVKLRGFNHDLASVFANGVINVVYIDALHTYEAVRGDIHRWWPKIADGGYIGGHNHGARWPGVTRAVLEAFGGPDKLYCDSSWIVRKQLRH
jgi:hypothetical protein